MFILLDIDGVMVPAKSWNRPELLDDGFPVFSTSAVKCLNELLSITQAKIVLTTSHRHRYSIQQWMDIFKKRGVIASFEKSDDSSLEFNSRLEQISFWINKNSSRGDFMIIDDDKSLNDLPMKWRQGRLISTSPLVGLNDSHIPEVLANRITVS